MSVVIEAYGPLEYSYYGYDDATAICECGDYAAYMIVDDTSGDGGVVGFLCELCCLLYGYGE
jgi:hypothetical protein